MSRRGESIYKRKDGRWEARYIHHYENGKAKYRYVYAKTYAEVKAKRFEEQKSLDFKTSFTNKTTIKFEELSRLWLQEIKHSVKESTYARYYRAVSLKLNPYIGSEPLIKLDLQIFKKLHLYLLQHGGENKQPLSEKSVSDILSILKTIYKFGYAQGFPCTDLSSISVNSKTNKNISVLSKHSMEKLQAKLFKSSDRVSLGILFALYTGVRIGELCGLRYEDIDLNSGTVKIQRTIERIPNLNKDVLSKTKVVITVPKTKNSFRVIPLPKFLIEYISKFPSEDSWYLLTGTEKYTEPHQFYLRYKTYLRQAGIENYTFHTLRHTFATNCIEHGFDAKSLSEILGHSDISTTLAIYVHPTMSQKQELMERLASALSSIF